VRGEDLLCNRHSHDETSPRKNTPPVAARFRGRVGERWAALNAPNEEEAPQWARSGVVVG